MLARRPDGFTLIELLVTLAVIGVLASIVMFGVSGVRENARDAERQSDLRAMQAAVESYKQRYGRYPAMATAGGDCTYVDGFATETSCYPYIVGLEPFMSVLPRDPNREFDEGYGYVTNAEGSVYKIIAMGTVETENVDKGHPFESCDFSLITKDMVNPDLGGAQTEIILCEQVIDEGNNTPNRCQEGNARFDSSYAVYGGYAQQMTGYFMNNNSAVDLTQEIRCK